MSEDLSTHVDKKEVKLMWITGHRMGR